MTMPLTRVAVLACALTAMLDATTDYAQHTESSQTHTLRFAGTGPHSLDVRTLDGSIRVSGQAGNDVQIEVHKRVSADTKEDLQLGERDTRLDIVDNAARLEAVARQRERSCGESWRDERNGWRGRTRYRTSFDFTVRVPADTRLRLCTVNNGDIRVDGTIGDFEIDNVNGRITMENVRGSGDAVTVNGGIVASFVQSPKADSFFKTINGDLVITYPAALSANLRMKTFNGGLFTDFEVEPLAREPGKAERQGGRFVYRSNGFTTVRVNGGGPELTFDAFNGDVRILRAAR